MRVKVLVLLAASAMPLLGCSRHNEVTGPHARTEHGATVGPQPIYLGLPPLPAEHESSIITDFKLPGSAAFEQSGNATADGSVMKLIGGPGELAWAMYQLSLGQDMPLYIDVDFSISNPPEPDKGVYVAVGNYERQSWDTSGPYFGRKVLPLDAVKHKSPGNNFVIAIILPLVQGSPYEARVKQLTLMRDHFNSPPTAGLEADVTLGDVPLLVSFDASVSSDPDGNISRFLWDFNGDGIYEESSSLPAVQHTFEEAGIIAVRVAVEDADGERSIAKINLDLNVAGNNRPNAELFASPQSGAAPLEVSFNAGGSRDTGGGLIARYDWDFDGDGSWDQYDGPAAPKHYYQDPGKFNAKVQVTDNSGAQSWDQLVVLVEGIYEPTPIIVTDPEVPSGTSLAIVDGKPAVAISYTNGAAIFASASDPGGSVWPSAQSISLLVPINGTPYPVNVTYIPTLLNVDGTPAVIFGTRIYGKWNLNSWNYRSAMDSAGQDWLDTGITVLEWAQAFEGGVDANLQFYYSAALINGYPAVALSNSDNFNALVYEQAPSLQPDGIEWTFAPSGEIAEPGSASGHGQSLTNVLGRPACSYVDGGSLFFKLALSAEGDQWPASPSFLDGPFECALSSLAVVAGKPAVCYYYNASELRYVRAEDSLGLLWGVPHVLDNFGPNPNAALESRPTLAVINGKPGICYCVETNSVSSVRYIHALDDLGSQWPSTPLTIAENAAYPSLTEVNGGFGISYIADSNAVYYVSGFW